MLQPRQARADLGVMAIMGTTYSSVLKNRSLATRFSLIFLYGGACPSEGETMYSELCGLGVTQLKNDVSLENFAYHLIHILL